MKAKDYRDYLLEKYNDTKYIKRKDVKILAYRFLTERGLWQAFVLEVRNFCDRPLTAEQVLSRMTRCARRPGDVLVKTNCTFDWNKAIYGMTRMDTFGYSKLWSNLYTEWSMFLNKLYYLSFEDLEF